VIGAIAATTPLAVTTAVTCPTIRLHPAIVAQAAATSSLLLGGRFELGVGTGENLNEHILGSHWPPAAIRLEMLQEAVELMRALWTGEEISHWGRYYTVENARLYSLPAEAPAVVMSAFGPQAVDVAARLADGYVSTRPDKTLLDRYRRGGGLGTAAAGLKVCWGPDARQCAELVHHLWRSSGVPGELSQELRTPALFEQATSNVSVDDATMRVPCGPDPQPIVDAVQAYADAGFDRIYINQIGPRQEDFFRFFMHELGAALAAIGVAPDADASMVAED
jgi:G6PDH family F420-dependent oxidoreductase